MFCPQDAAPGNVFDLRTSICFRLYSEYNHFRHRSAEDFHTLVVAAIHNQITCQNVHSLQACAYQHEDQNTRVMHCVPTTFTYVTLITFLLRLNWLISNFHFYIRLCIFDSLFFKAADEHCTPPAD